MSLLYAFFQPTYDALFSTLPFDYRWRLLAFQPLAILIFSMRCVPWAFSNRYSVIYIPTREGRKVRALLFRPLKKLDNGSSPLHVFLHSGGFISGIPETGAEWCSLLSDRIGAVVVAPTYRFAPRFPFPAAIDDADHVVSWLFEHAEKEFGATTKLFTTSGYSAGANLALAVSQQSRCQYPSETNIKATMLAYAAIDMRSDPQEKPKGKGIPKYDPAAFMFPLFASYRGSKEGPKMDDPRLSPCLAKTETLPEDILFIVPTMDIVVKEQLESVERVRQELPRDSTRRVEAMVMESQMHGWLELPRVMVDEKSRTEAFDAMIGFITESLRKHGWK